MKGNIDILYSERIFGMVQNPVVVCDFNLPVYGVLQYNE